VGLATFMALRQVADVIALDQRGAGQSTPRLDCAGSWEFPLDRPGDPKEFLRLATRRMRNCARELGRQGIDLSGYTTRESADDVEALRRALGIPEISLWGVSYGTHLALAVLRRHERSIHRVILTGVDGPDHALLKLPSAIQAQLLAVDRLCKEDPQVRQKLPDFLGLVKRTAARLEKAPVSVRVPDPRDGRSVQVVVGPWDFRFYTSRAVMNTWQLRKLPSVFGALAEGDFAPLAREVLAFRRSQLPPMMGLLMVCSSGASAERRARIRREAGQTLLGEAVNFPFPELCQVVGHPSLGPDFRLPVRSAVPTLFISGTLDGNTPVRNAEEVRKGFPNSQHLIIEGASHGYDLFYFAPGLNAVMQEFLCGRPLTTTRIRLSSFPFLLEETRGERGPGRDR
jgi:pimeloyl-ACP methyl ester carboxylesterase